MRIDNVKKITFAGLMAALCYVGYAVFPAINAAGTKIHIGNAFVVLGALLLGGLYGGLAGAVGLSKQTSLSAIQLQPQEPLLPSLLSALSLVLLLTRLLRYPKTIKRHIYSDGQLSQLLQDLDLTVFSSLRSSISGIRSLSPMRKKPNQQ